MVSTTLFLLALAATGGLAQKYCKVTEDNVACRSCPSTSCDVISRIPKGTQDFYQCRWTRGESVSGYKGWDYNSNRDCFVTQVYTDDNCCPSGCMQSCIVF